MDELDDSTTKSDKSLKSFSVSSKGAGEAMRGAGSLIGTATTAIIAAGTALSTFVVMTAKSNRELEILARQAKLSTDEFAALSFATKQYGIDAEQIGDISKDVADKLGEFAKDGTGPFQDFASVTGMAKDEAQALAVQMADMSSEQVIGELVRRMEDAGASTNQMTFAMESMGNDLVRLLPLFADNGKELKDLKGSYAEATAGMKLTQEQAKNLEGSAKSFDKLTTSIGASSKLIAAVLAPAVTDFFNEVQSIIPLVTEDLVNFINSFKSIGNLNSIAEVEGQIGNIRIEMDRLNSRHEKGFMSTAVRDKEIAKEQEKLDELEARLKVIKDGISSSDDGGSADGGGKPSEKPLTAEEEFQRILAEIRAENRKIEAEARVAADADAVQAIADRFKTEEDLLKEKLEREMEIIGEDKELKKELEEEYQSALNDIKIEAAEKLAAEEEKMNRKRKREDDKKQREDQKRLREDRAVQDSYLSAAKTISDEFLADKKAVGAGLIIADTAVGITRAFADLPYPAALAASASIAATGVVQLAALNSASKGGGGSPSSAIAADTSFEPDDRSELLLSQSDSSGANQNVIIRFEGGGDEITEAIAKNMTVLQRNGTLEA